MLPFGMTICLFILVLSTPTVVPLTEIFYILLALALLLYFLLRRQKFQMTLAILEHLSESKFCSIIKKDLAHFLTVPLLGSSWATLIL